MSDHPHPSDGAPTEPVPPTPSSATVPSSAVARPVEVGGRRRDVSAGLEPTRFGDWEKDGRCIDF